MDAKIPVLVLAAALSPALANDSDLGSAPLRIAQASRTDEPAFAQLQQQMKRMRDTVARLQETTHPEERQELIDRHERELRQGMRLMLEHERAMEDGFR